MHAVLDPKVLISAVLSPNGTPARLLAAWQRGAFEFLASPLLIDELNRALACPKLRERVSADEAGELIAWFERAATVVEDPQDPPPVRSDDPGDDYLIALAGAHRAALVSGDEHLLALADELPVFSVRELLDRR